MEDVEDWFPHDYSCSPNRAAWPFYCNSILEIPDPRNYFDISEAFAKVIAHEHRAEARLKLRLEKQAQYEAALELKRQQLRRERITELWKNRRFLRRFLACWLYMLRKLARWQRTAFSLRAEAEVKGCRTKAFVFFEKQVSQLKSKLLEVSPNYVRPRWYLRKNHIFRFYILPDKLPRSARLVLVSKIEDSSIIREHFPTNVLWRHGDYAVTQHHF